MKHDLKTSRFNSKDSKLYKCVKCKEFYYEKFNATKMKLKKKNSEKDGYYPFENYKNAFKLIKVNILGTEIMDKSYGVWILKNGKNYLINPFTGKKLYSNSRCKYSHVDLMVKDII